jgi:hypothetical protein
VICEYESTVKLAATPLNLTRLAPVRAEPLIVTLVPAGPLVGEKLAIVGLTLNEPALAAVPSAFVTLMWPVRAPFGTLVVIFTSETTVNAALDPLNETSVAPVKPLPLTVTAFPTAPAIGEKPLIAGTAARAAAGSSAVLTRPARISTTTRQRLTPKLAFILSPFLPRLRSQKLGTSARGNPRISAPTSLKAACAQPLMRR